MWSDFCLRMLPISDCIRTEDVELLASFMLSHFCTAHICTTKELSNVLGENCAKLNHRFWEKMEHRTYDSCVLRLDERVQKVDLIFLSRKMSNSFDWLADIKAHHLDTSSSTKE